MAKQSLDAFANKAYGSVTQSAANTLTFNLINMGMTIFQRTALVIHRLKYYPNASACRELVAATDRFSVAITSSNRLTTIQDVGDPAILDLYEIVCVAANIEPVKNPLISDFTMLPGGGKLVPPNPLYIACSTAGFAAAAFVRVEMEFTFKELSDSDYLELLQAVYPANVS